ncbi:MAG TPA: type II toxin-antitoxin system VapC family toxin [Rhizomicrobium sp.]
MRQPFLLDTCAALWIVAGEISQKTVDALSQARSAGFVTYISPITAWEVGLLARKGRFRSDITPQRWFEKLMKVPDTALVELSARVLLESSFLPGRLQSDPADRIIAATAREYGYTVMTRDRALLDYAGQGYLSAMEC